MRRHHSLVLRALALVALPSGCGSGSNHAGATGPVADASTESDAATAGDASVAVGDASVPVGDGSAASEDGASDGGAPIVDAAAVPLPDGSCLADQGAPGACTVTRPELTEAGA